MITIEENKNCGDLEINEIKEIGIKLNMIFKI